MYELPHMHLFLPKTECKCFQAISFFSECNLEIMGRVRKFLKRVPVNENFLEIQHKINKPEKKALFLWIWEKSDTVFPLIRARPQIGAAPLGMHIEISASPLISAMPLNLVLIRIVTIIY